MINNPAVPETLPQAQEDNSVPVAPPRPTDANGNPIYRVPEQNLDRLLAKLDKLNKRAKRLRMEPLVLTEVGEEFETRRKLVNPLGDGEEFEAWAGCAPKYVTIQVRFVLVTVVGKTPRINGWAFAATLGHEDGGNILRVSPEFSEVLPLRYRTAGTDCEHCRTNRQRTDTYVLYNEDLKSWKQVGRSCLQDFLRTTNPASLAEWAEVIASLDDELGGFEDEGFGGGGSGPVYWPTLTLLAQVACCIRLDGWCSRGEAKASYIPKTATVDQATDWFSDSYVRKQSPADREKYTPTEADAKLAADAIAWAQAIEADVQNDYLWNIRLVSFKEAVRGRDAGLGGSIVSAYSRFLERELAKKYERDNPSEYFGTPGEREVFTLTCIGLRELEGNYGLTTMVRLRDAAGNKAVWFASGSPSFDVVLDGTYTVKATVKAHEDYKGHRQTQLSRVVLHVEKPAKVRKVRAKEAVAA